VSKDPIVRAKARRCRLPWPVGVTSIPALAALGAFSRSCLADREGEALALH
jgi:hypothetical protein